MSLFLRQAGRRSPRRGTSTWSPGPQSEIQVGTEHIPVLARTAAPEKKSRPWRIMTDQRPDYDIYQTLSSRIIPLVVLGPT